MAKAAIRHTMNVASETGRFVSLTLSDSFCVDRHRHEWLDLISDMVDLVFANETEICSLFETEEFDSAAARAADITEVVALTRAAEGSVVISGNERVEVPAVYVPRIVDATGAGDLYASGFLFGMAKGADLARCAELGAVAAAEIISHVGARPRE